MKMNEDKMAISDGYHTFGELYAHRGALFILSGSLLGMLKPGSKPWFSALDSEEREVEKGFLLAGFSVENRQVSYHIEADFKPALLAAGFNEVEHAPDFDGHSSMDVFNRLISASETFGEHSEIRENDG